jgi:SdrD B-like protein
MRVLMVLIALVATPFLTSVAQGSPSAGKGGGECKAKHANNGKHLGWRNGQHDDCNAPALGGISGTVFYDLSYDGLHDADEAGLANWNVMLSGPVNATAVTDAAGNYSFTGLPAGTYTVCESQRFAWMQTGPLTASSCASGYGYTIVITAGQVVTLLDFGNVG